MTTGRQFATFFVDNLYLGVEVLRVQEVLRSLEITRVPLADRAIEGLINLRGQIVTAIDLRARLDLPPRPRDRAPMHVVIRTEDGAVSLLVDEIGDVIETDPRTFERAPETLTGEGRALISGVYKLDEHLMLVLDTARTVALGPAAAGT